MDYEQKYKEALKRADSLTEKYGGREFAEYAFPELAESEDERIRKRIYSIIYHNDALLDKEELLAWLEKQKDLDKMIVVSPEVWDKAINDAYENGKKDGEKQKEQKSVDYEAELKKCKDNPLYFYDKYVSIKQKPVKWSEEDERILKGIIGKIDHDQTYGVSKAEMLSFLKSLRPDSYKNCNSRWKPSEEQMDALKDAVRLFKETHFEKFHYKIESLYEQLQKL